MPPEDDALPETPETEPEAEAEPAEPEAPEPPERDPYDDTDWDEPADEGEEAGADEKPEDDSEDPGEPKPEDPKKEGEGKDAAPQETVEIDGEKIPKARLAEAWKARQTSEISSREAKRLKDSVQYAYEELARNPFKILLDIETRRLGNREQAETRVAQMAEEFVLPFMQEKLMTPEQREAARLKRRVRYYEETEQQRRAREEEKKLTDERQRYSDWISGQITDAIKASGLPDKPHVVKQMAAILSGQMEAGEEPDPGRAAAQIQQDISELRSGLLKTLTPEEIRATRADLLEAARKADIETAREKRRQPTTRAAAASRESSARQNGRGRRPVYKTLEQFREAVGVDPYIDW